MTRNYTKLIYLLPFFTGWLVGCSNKTQQVPPTYVHVDSFSFGPRPTLSATGSHQITEVWAYYNDAAVGVFDLPCTFPVITNGSVGQLELSPGVVVDGLNDFLIAYPFYSIDTFTLTTQPGKIVTHEPKTDYFSDIKYTILSSFEGNLGFGLYSGNKQITTTHLEQNVFEGGASGIITLTSPTDTSEDSSHFFVIPTGYSFIEFNYKSDVQFYVGLGANESSIVSSSPYYLSGINPSSTWQKFYLTTQDFASHYQGTSYNLYIKTYLLPGATSGTVLLDNIQLVSF
jgi:hypothetical protein